jgi:hypothetical protein
MVETVQPTVLSVSLTVHAITARGISNGLCNRMHALLAKDEVRRVICRNWITLR